MDGCTHEWLDVDRPSRMAKTRSVRFFFYCKRCLAIQYRDVPETFWEWAEPEPWRGDGLPAAP